MRSHAVFSATFAVTAEPHAVVRLRRALESERCTADQIRAIVAELPRPPGLEDALRILLALLDREPATYPRAAARWGSRFILERRLTLPDAQLMLAALAVLPEPGARAGVEALAELANSYGLHGLNELLMTWAKRRGLPT
jgi:hypothetical protein